MLLIICILNTREQKGWRCHRINLLRIAKQDRMVTGTNVVVGGEASRHYRLTASFTNRTAKYTLPTEPVIKIFAYPVLILYIIGVQDYL